MNKNDLFISNDLLSKLRACKSTTPKAIATDLQKFNQIAEIDYEMAIVRARRAVDMLLRSIALKNDINPGSKPMEHVLGELTRANLIPPLIDKHCRVIKNFGNIAAHGVDNENFEGNDLLLSESEMYLCKESVCKIIQWYILKTNFHLTDKLSLEIFSGSNVTKEMIDGALEIDKIVYPDNLSGIREVCYDWLERNPDIYVILMDPNLDKVIGYINAMPLEEEYYNIMLEGNSIDVNLPVSAIRTYDYPDFYHLYFSSIVIHPSFQSTDAFKKLYDAFIDKLLELARREVYMIEIIADAVTKEGIRLCEYAGMQKVKSSNHNSMIYKSTLLPPLLRVTSIRTKNLSLFYQKLYDQFKDILT